MEMHLVDGKGNVMALCQVVLGSFAGGTLCDTARQLDSHQSQICGFIYLSVYSGVWIPTAHKSYVFHSR